MLAAPIQVTWKFKTDRMAQSFTWSMFLSVFLQIEIADLAAYTLLPYIVQGGLGLLSGVIAGE
jgi:hypothetical protein